MNRILYLLYQTKKKIVYQKKRYILYVLSFYVGLLLPAFCIANIRSVNRVIHYTTFEHMEESVQISWFSDCFDYSELEGNGTVSASIEEDFVQWNHEYVSVKGIDEQYCYPLPEVIGRTFDEQEFQEGRKVCLLSKDIADEYGYKLKNKITIQGTEFRIVGLIDDDIYTSAIMIPYQSLRQLYEEREILQFEGTFFIDEDRKEEEIEAILKQIQTSDENAEILDVTDGQDLYENAQYTKNQWRMVRGTVAVVALIFFLLNEMIVLTEKVEKERNMVGVNRAVGASKREMSLSFFFETMAITLVATTAVLFTIKPLGMLVGLSSALVVDRIMVIEFLVIAVVVCEILTWLVMRRIKRMSISTMLKTKEL